MLIVMATWKYLQIMYGKPSWEPLFWNKHAKIDYNYPCENVKKFKTPKASDFIGIGIKRSNKKLFDSIESTGGGHHFQRLYLSLIHI